MYITLELWHVSLGFKVYRQLAVFILNVGEEIKMEQMNLIVILPSRG